MRKPTAVFLVLFALSMSYALPAFSCDLCAIYRGTEAKLSKPGFNVGVFEQFTHFGTLQDNGEEVPDEVGQYMDSSITQFIVGYQINERGGLQVNVPYISRTFRRPEGFDIDKGTESGLGDLSLTGNLRLFEEVGLDTIFIWDAFGGVKFPTGDAGRLKEEFDETEVAGAPESGIHGHDLALGSGSYDVVIGASASYHWKRIFTTAAVQYAIRTRGAYGYRYADDLNWSVKPGGYLYLTDEATAGLQLALTGESKGKDRFQDESAADTGITSVFVGPELSFTWKEKLSVDLGADFPVARHNTSLQIVPDYKIRAALVWRM